MEGLLLTLVVIGMSIQSISKKDYNQKVNGGAFTFSAASILFALFVFIVVAKGKFEYNSGVMIYALLFAASYSLACLMSFVAIKTGLLSLSSLFIQYSLIIPTVYGLIVLKEPIKPTLIFGIIFLCISLVLVNIEKKDDKKITFKWVVAIFLAFVGNGACSTVQKAQQIAFDGMYKSELMIVALLVSSVVMFVFAGAFEKKETFSYLKKGFWLYALCGIANGLVNFFVLVLSNTVPASVMFPIIAAGGIILTALVSIFLYKEKLSTPQKIGFILGVLAIVFLNI